MKYVKGYNDYKDSINEEFILGAIMKTLGNLFKKAFTALKDGWKKWTTEEEAQKGIIQQLDIIGKNCTDAISKADTKAAVEEAKTTFENEVNNIVNQLKKELQTVKEEAGGKRDMLLSVVASVSKLSNLIGASKTGNFAKQIAAFQTQKDLANDEKKLLAKIKPIEIQIVNNEIAELKKILGDPEKFKQMVEEYKKTNKVEGSKKEEYKVGDSVIYKRDKFEEEDWAKITDEDKKKPNEGPMKELQDSEQIGIKKIKEIKGEDVTFEDADFTKKLSDLLGKVEGVENAKVEYKAGDNVIYKREKFNEESWKKITDEDKKKPNEGPMKDLQDKEEIGIKNLKSDVKEPNNPEGIVEFEGFNKKVSDLLGKIEGDVAKVDGQVELQKNLAELKAKKPDTITNIKNYSDFLLSADEESIKTISDLIEDEKKK